MKLKICSCSTCVGENPEFIKYGKTNCGKQRYQCKSCKTTSVLKYNYNAYKRNINQKIIQLTKEGVGIRSTARILKISTTTLLKRIVEIAKNILHPPIAKGKIYEMDELRTFIKRKENGIWLVYAIDQATRKVVNFTIGNRSNATLSKVIGTLKLSEAMKIFTDK